MRPAFLSLFLLLSISARAATFIVSSSADSGPGTLRQAILDANANPGADQITFTTPAVVATSTMPDITDVVHIDGSVGGGRVDIQGVDDISAPYAFRFGDFIGSADGSTLTRVSVRVYTDALVIDAEGVTVTDSAFENTSRVRGDGNTIGGGNTFEMLNITGNNNVVEGNTIGAVLVSGGADNRIGSIGNGNTIGTVPITVPFFSNITLLVTSAGYTFIEGNEIASNHTYGIRLEAGFIPAHGATVSGNTIHGQDTGIFVWGLGTPGVFLSARILGNSIYDVGIPIDLQEIFFVSSPNGPTANDPAPDADIGGNNLQNYPVLDSAIATGAGMTVSGSLTSAPLTTYRVELFVNPTSAPDEARTPLTTFDVTTDATGTAAFTQVLSPQAGALTSTATNLTTNDTSEVSAPVVIDASGQLSFNPITYNANEGTLDVTLTVVRTGGNTNTVTVDFATVNGTAIAPNDYATTTGTLTFGPGVTSQTIVIPIAGDQIGEPAETFTVVLSNPTNGATIGNGTATVTIAAEEGGVPIPTASTWALIALSAALAAIAVAAMRA